MKAVIAREPGGPDVLQQVQRPEPIAQAGEVLGLEAAGIVVAVGSGVDEFAPGDRVMALLNGGGYAEFCVADAAHCLAVPVGLSLQQAAEAHRLLEANASVGKVVLTVAQ